MKEKLKIYLKENLYVEKTIFKASRHSIMNDENICYEGALNQNINQYINENNNYNKFQTLLFKYIDDRNLKDSDVYNKVHIDRRLFSKIRSDIEYHPSKETIILLGLSLELNENEIVELLDSASYSLPKNNYYDLIIRFCFINKIYKINDVNNLLNDYDCKLFNY